MGTYSTLGNYGAINAATLIEVNHEDSTNFLIRLPVASVDGRYRAQWRLRSMNNGWFMAGIAFIDRDGYVADITMMDASSAFEYAFRLGENGDSVGSPVNAFDFVGSVHGHQNMTSVTLELDGVDISGLATGASAYGTQFVVTQEIDDYYPVDDTTVAAVTTLMHTFTYDLLRMDASHVFNSAQAWEIYNHYGCMLPVLESGADTMQVEGFSATLANNDDGGFYQDGTEATWCEFSDTGHTYKVRATMPTGSPNTAGDWDLTGAIKAGVQDRSDGINKFYAENISVTFADRIDAQGLTLASRTDYTVST